MQKNDVVEISEVLEKDITIYNIMKQCPYEILRAVKIKKYKANEFVLEQGEIYHTIYLVLEGELDIYFESEHGKKYYLNTYRKGNYIGELEMFGSHPYISRVEAKTNIRILEIAREDFIKWLQLDRNLNDYFVNTLCNSSYELCRNMGTNTLYTLKQRICKYLMDSIVDQAHPDNAVLSIKTENIGERMAATQRSVNRILKQLRENGIIEISKSHVCIKDYKRLVRETEE